VTHSTKPVRPKKPRSDFPLFPHAAGYWAKKVRQKLHYFGKIADDPKGEAALNLWLDRKDDLLAGRTPRTTPGGLTVENLCNHFLFAKEQQRDAGDITARTFVDYLATCRFVAAAFGKTRLVDDLAADDFQALRANFAKLYGVHRLGKEVQRCRMIFKYGVEAGLIDKAPRFGPTFKRPPTRAMRAHRQKNGNRMLEPAGLRTIIDKAEQPLKAMILLGLNAGFGNSDCGRLPKSALDLKDGWINFPRPKTAIERRCPLWPETIAALQEAIARRPAAKQRSDDKLVFITKYGASWAKDTADNPITKVFRILLDELGLHRPGVGFYALRHIFETIGGDSRDQVAVNYIMGHSDPSMAAVYREQIEDDRLRAVVNHVRAWLFAKPKKK
jgi:integrase